MEFRTKSVAASALVLAIVFNPLYANAGGRSVSGVVNDDRQAKSPTSGSCKIPKADFMTSSLTASITSSTTFVDVPEATVTFKQAGTTSGCILVNFTGEPFAQGNGEVVMVRVLVDGATELAPGPEQFSGDDDEDSDGHWTRAQAFMWTGVVTPGSHIIQVQYKSYFGGPISMNRHTTTVFHR